MNPMVAMQKTTFPEKNKKIISRMIRNYQLYLFILPTVAYFFIFKYIPMYGVQIAFKNYRVSKGFTHSPWMGFMHFERFFNSFYFWDLINNTLGLSLYQLVVGFPLPIIVALMLNKLISERYKKFVQTLIYAPHFISTVVLVGMVFVFLSPRSGLVNQIIVMLGGEPVLFMGSPQWFKTIYVFSGIWQNTGWGTIIYLAALSNINQEVYQSADVDGASKLQKIWYIDIPEILNTAIIILILDMGRVMSVGFEKAYLMQTALNLQSSEIISTYVYKSGLIGVQYSYATAVSLFNSVINFILLITVNKVSKKINDISLW